ncbi:DUF504 domain-containing protein [Candidatus Woesearchaeota archaeon]|nr:MAG: DUF504 domain-containing protein [Candidatus Woesearchaeota archaeon]
MNLASLLSSIVWEEKHKKDFEIIIINEEQLPEKIDPESIIRIENNAIYVETEHNVRLIPFHRVKYIMHKDKEIWRR